MIEKKNLEKKGILKNGLMVRRIKKIILRRNIQFLLSNDD